MFALIGIQLKSIRNENSISFNCYRVLEFQESKQLSHFPSQSDCSASYLQRGSTASGASEAFVGLSFEIPPARHFDIVSLQGFWVFSLVGNLL